MNPSPVVFVPLSTLQVHVVGATGLYRIEAAGAQGGAGGGPGGKGARVRGTFYLREGEHLCVIVGARGDSGRNATHAAGGGGGGSFVWRGRPGERRPNYPLLAAGGGGGGNGGGGLVSAEGGAGAAAGGRDGEGGDSDRARFRYSGGGGAGWRSAGLSGSMPTLCGGGDHWAGGQGANYGGFHGGDGGFGGGGGGCFFGNGSGGGGGFSGGGGGSSHGPGAGGGGSFNAGADQGNEPGVNQGDGAVTLTLVEALADAQIDLPQASTPPRIITIQRPALLALQFPKLVGPDLLGDFATC